MNGAPPVLASNRLIARNSLLNLTGLVGPMVVAFVAIPILISGLGTDRYGVLMYAWALVGYFSLLDLGLGQALTQVVAERLGGNRAGEIPTYAWTALLLMAGLGALGGLALAGLTPFLVHHAFKIPASLQPETLSALYLLALSLPIVISSAGLRGVLEANQNFGIVNAIRMPMGALSFLAPVMVLPFSHSLRDIIGALVALRVVGWGLHLGFCLRKLPVLRHGVVFDRTVVFALARYGGWLSASNVANTFLVYLDRFLIGALLSMAAVAHYVTPYEAVIKLWTIPGALLGVFFPAIAASFTIDRHRVAVLFDRAVRSIFLLVFPASFAIAMLAHLVLQLWVGPEFALHSTRVMQWMAVGVFINCLGMVPSAGLQGVGRPDLTGKLNLIELPLYVGMLWWLLTTKGIEGAAMAWVIRAGFDTLVLFAMAERVLPIGAYLRERLLVFLVPATLLIAAGMLNWTVTAQLILVLVVWATFPVVAWQMVLTDRERYRIKRLLIRDHVVLPTS